jgi:uncharacterized protein YcbK (DUF882 family)
MNRRDFLKIVGPSLATPLLAKPSDDRILLDFIGKKLKGKDSEQIKEFVESENAIETIRDIIAKEVGHSSDSQYRAEIELIHQQKPSYYEGNRDDRHIEIINSKTNERFSGYYVRNGRFDKEAIDTLSYLFRDLRANKVKAIDPYLIDFIYFARVKTFSKSPFILLSGYRTPATNRLLKRLGHKVAKNSQHLKAKASDGFLHNRSVYDLAKAARALQLGGVGEYDKNGFVHLDTGRYRKWYG